MPPKKDSKKQVVGKVDNSGMPKQDVEFKFTLTVRSDLTEIPSVLMLEWFTASDKLQRWETPSIDSWKKNEGVYTFQKQCDIIRVDDDFCRILTSKNLFIYFVNGEDSKVEHILRLDYSSLLTTANEPPSFSFQSSTIRMAGVDHFTFKLQADKPLLGQVFKQYLNPLEIEVIGAIDTPTESSSKYEPAYVKYVFFDGTVIQTHGVIGTDKLIWEHKHVFLLGLMDPDELKERLRSRYLKFDLHDRDVLRDNKPKPDIQLFDIAKAIQDELQKEKPVEEDAKKKGAKKEEKKEVKKEVKKDPKKKQKVGEPILPVQPETIKTNYGIAAYSMVDYLKPSMKSVRYKAPVVPRNTFEDFQSRNIDLNTTARNDMQKVISANSYYQCDTFLVVGFKLSYPIGVFVKPAPVAQSAPVDPKSKLPSPSIPKPKQEANPSTPKTFFERVVYLVPYKDSANIKTIEDIFYETNMQALGVKSKREVSTCVLTAQQKNSRELNFISGIQIIDPEGRIYILEGLHGKSLEPLHAKMIKGPENPKELRIFKNSTLTFTTRLYADFNIELKRIRLMPSLNSILIRPSVYIQSKINEDISLNLTRIGDIRRICNDLASVDAMNLWPNADYLVQIERKFSQSLSAQDITGQENAVKSKHQLEGGSSQVQTIPFAESTELKYFTTDQFFQPRAPIVVSEPVIADATDRKGVNVLTKTFCKDETKLSLSYTMKGKTANIPPNEPVYIYAGQKLNHYEKQMKQLRHTAQSNPKVMYTYGKGHLRLMIDPYTIEEQAKRELQLSQSKVYAPQQPFSSLPVRTQQERMRLPNRIKDEDAIDLLKYPYHQQKEREKGLQRNPRDEPLGNGLPQFHKYLKHQEIFSIPEVLPGAIITPADREKQEREARRAYQQAQKKKQFGDDFMKIKKGYCSDKATGIDKFKDIREDAAHKMGIIDIHKKSGAKRPIDKYEVSLFQAEKVGDPAFNPLIRRDNPSANTVKDEFNFYQRPQILTSTIIHKPLKKDI